MSDRKAVLALGSLDSDARSIGSNGRAGDADGRSKTDRARWASSWRRATLVQRAAWGGRTGLLACGNLLLLAAVYWLAFALRFDFRIPADWIGVFWMTLPWVLGFKMGVFYASGQYHGWWFHVAFADLIALGRAALLSLVAIAAVDHFVLPQQIPRAVLLLDCVMTLVVYGAVRASGRFLLEHVRPALRQRVSRPALLVGVDRSSGVLAHQINGHAELTHQIRGFLSTNGRAPRQWLGQIPVLGHLNDVRRIAARNRVSDILVIAGTLSGQRMRWLMKACDLAGLSLRIIRPLEDLFNGDRRIPQRGVEIGDLLRRTPVDLDPEAIGGLLSGRRLLVTGAGGSIGSEISRQVLRFAPAELVVLGRGENRIFTIEHELRNLDRSAKLSSVIADVTDKVRMRQVFERHRPDVVLHAAAHKHVPLMEANVGEAIKNNVLGTRCVADLADECGTGHFVLISSDKAVNPTSVMGATKRLAERYVQALSAQSPTQYVVVRFGNVLGTANSVVPLFQSQIRRGGPITVTDPRMIRYFMTIPEAAQLVLQASAMGRGGEVFVLDMGEPVRIVDLARDLIRLSGLPANAIDIIYTGIRPGEKLEEELYFGDEQTLPTAHAKVHLAQPCCCELRGVVEQVTSLEDAVGQSDEQLRLRLQEVVPGYRPVPDDRRRSDQPVPPGCPK